MIILPLTTGIRVVFKSSTGVYHENLRYSCENIFAKSPTKFVLHLVYFIDVILTNVCDKP